MSNFIKCYSRFNSILTLLKTQGPLSSRTITKLIVPKMNHKRVLGSLSRLQKRGLVIKRMEKVFRGAGTFYQLAQDKDSMAEIADMLCCPVEELVQPQFRYRELLHNENTAYCASEIKRLIPEAIIIRDFEFQTHPMAARAMLINAKDYELKPDFLVAVPSATTEGMIFVAVEIEKTRKSDERLVYKLGKLTDRTQLDGVIYFCDTKQLVDVVCSTFTNKVLSKSSRIGHYPEHFMLFSRSENDEPVMPLEVYNSTGQKVFLEKWINYLKATQPLDRRDKNFETLGVSS